MPEETGSIQIKTRDYPIEYKIDQSYSEKNKEIILSDLDNNMEEFLETLNEICKKEFPLIPMDQIQVGIAHELDENSDYNDHIPTNSLSIEGPK